MKILFAPAHYMLEGVAGGGEFSWAYNIVRSLAAYPEVEIIAITGLATLPEPFPPNVRIITLNRGPLLHLTWSYRLAFVFKTFWAARRLLKVEKVDVVHHILPFGFRSTFSLLALLGAVRHAPFIVGPLQAAHTYASDEEFIISSQGKFAKYNSTLDMLQDRIGGFAARAGRGLLAYLSHATLRRSTMLIAVNEETADFYGDDTPGLQVKPLVIPPGIQVGPFEHGATGQRSGVEIITVGSLIKRKGVDLIIRAMVELKDTHPHLRLRIVGDGPQRRSLEILAHDLGVRDRIIFQGFVPNMDMPEFYHTADVYVSMSYSESFGQTLVEAMATGLCVLAASNVGSRGIIDNGRTGFLVRSGDGAHLVDILRRVFDDPHLRTTVGSTAQQTVKECFDWSKIAARYMALYKSLQSVRQ